jgi:hypothetical protein
MISSEDVYDALYRIASEESEPINQAILDRLVEPKIDEIQPDGKPTFTRIGERCYVGMESGDWGTPEFK